MATYRGQNPTGLIVQAVIQNKGADWGDETHALAESDAQRILEAVVAEIGVEGVVAALNHQGFRGESYRYLLRPLYAEAIARRSAAAGYPDSHIPAT